MPSTDPVETRIARVGDLDIAYETFGDPSDPTVLLVMGLSTQMVAWPDELCEGLAAAGHHVVRFDNRDIGLSTHVATPAPSLPAMLARRGTPYTISDMAGDAVGLLDTLDVERAHVVGVSMGGFISQTIAVEHPSRVATLSLLMTSTGSRRVGRPSVAVMRSFLDRKPVTTLEEAMDGAVATYRLIGSPDLDEEMIRETAALSFERGHDPAGPQRQLAAVLAQPDRTRALRRLDVPTIVLHGLDDPIVHVSGGLALARAIPGARFVGFHATGHDLPRSRASAVRDEVLGLIDRAGAPVRSG